MSKPIMAGKVPKMMEMQPGEYFWCACGKSSTQPFCDGTHAGSGIIPVRTLIEEKKQVFWCMCRKSKDKPFCDGTHKKLK